ncbi:MAG: sigma-70 family RNA polymerase sigma factor [Planctomycetota bacterium]
MTRARAGDEHAFDALFARVVPRLQWFVDLRMGARVRERVDRDDVIQDTYAAALTQLESFTPTREGAFASWLLAIAENQIRRLVAHHGAAHRRAVRSDRPADRALALAADPMSGPATRAERRDVRERVRAAMATMDAAEQEAVLLRVVEARPLAEVAEIMDRSESAVRRLVARALGSLGRQLSGEDVA